MKFNTTLSRRLSRLEMLLVAKPVTLLVLMMSVIFYQSHAQDIWGTISGDSYGNGSIFKVRTDSPDIVRVRFPGGGSNWIGDFGVNYENYGLCHFSGNGKFYGITLSGGENDQGVLFEFDPVSGTTDVKFAFEFYSDYGRPLSRLVEYNGKLYGTLDGLGRAVYSFNPTTNEFKREITIPSLCSDIVLVNDKFYGLTTQGGTKWAGAIFEFDPNAVTYTVLFQLDHQLTGRYPRGGLRHLDGKLYGVAASGGKFLHGTLFSYDIATHTFEKKIDFKSNVTGSIPIGTLVLHNGKFLGITESGGNFNQGVLFEYDPVTSSLRKLIDYNSISQGRTFQDFGGTLYGVSPTGGASGQGTLYSFDPVTLQYTSLHEFSEETGAMPFGMLTLDNGTFWGMTSQGGLGNGGTIYSFDIVTQQYQDRESFNYFPLGKKPTTLIEVNNQFYGLTAEGGTSGDGVLFKLDPATQQLSVLHNFQCDACPDDFYPTSNPEGALVVINNVLYGVTAKQGNAGELFSFDLGTNSYNHIHEFDNELTGINPAGRLAILNGKIYGSTYGGGANSQGVLFEWNPATSNYQVKLNLNVNTTGTSIKLSTVDNLLYGISTGSPYGRAMLIQYDPWTNSLVTRHQFQDPNRTYPSIPVVAKGSKVFGFTYTTSDYRARLYSFDTKTLEYKVLFQIPTQISDYTVFVASRNNFYASGYYSQNIVFNLNDGPAFTPMPEVIDYPAYYGVINSMVIVEDFFCTSENLITEVVDFQQGNRKDGLTIAADRSDPANTLYLADNFDNADRGIRFTTLGFGGSITLAFEQPLCDDMGSDFQVVETSYGNPSFYHNPERAEVFVSQDGTTWSSLGLTSPQNPFTNCSAKLDTDYDFHSTGLDWIKYVKVIDRSDPLARRRDVNSCLPNGPYAFNNAADGFDLDAVESKAGSLMLSAGRQAAAKPMDVVDITHTQTRAGLFPNPASKTLTIDLSEEEELVLFEDQVAFEVMDMNGRLLNNSMDKVEDWKVVHDVSELKPGLYIARIKNGNVRRSYRFVKQ